MRLNPRNEWARLPRWKKRIYGFFAYLAVACLCVWEPEGTDYVMLQMLREQFLED